MAISQRQMYKEVTQLYNPILIAAPIVDNHFKF